MHFDLRDRDVGVPLEVLRELVDRAERLGIAIVVIGAAARDLVVHAPTRQHPNRVTLDVDVAIAVDRDNKVQAERARDTLLDVGAKIVGVVVNGVSKGSSYDMNYATGSYRYGNYYQPSAGPIRTEPKDEEVEAEQLHA